MEYINFSKEINCSRISREDNQKNNKYNIKDPFKEMEKQFKGNNNKSIEKGDAIDF